MSIAEKIAGTFGYKIEKIVQVNKTIWNGKTPSVKRFEPYECQFLNHVLYVHDKGAFYLCYKELFEQEIYKFYTSSQQPFIIDCGANLGMSIIYFKMLYPHAHIIGFEADPHIFGFLQKNIQSFQYENVEIYNKAVWNKNDETLSFLEEGGAGGRIEQEGITATGNYIHVQTSRLKNYLSKKVDFLKIDIEGAEYSVIADCAEELKNVETLFIEWHGFANKKQDLHEILSIAHHAGFIYHIQPAFFRKQPFIDRNLNNGMDLQLNVFCYRK